MENIRLTRIVLPVAFLLLIPFIAMQFTEEVNWNVFDFIVAGVLLLSTGLLIDFVIKKVPKLQHRIFLCLAILVTLLLIWTELAVGIFGTPLAGS